MKRFLQLSIGMCLVFSMNTPAPANAIFGLSKCEKVQKQVISIEKDINSRIDYLKDFEGKVLHGKPLSVYNYVVNFKFRDELWKIGYNNPKCFTNTQKLAIKKLPEMSFIQFIGANPKFAYFTTGKCKDPWVRFSDKNCSKPITYILEFAKNWQSLYEY